MRIKKEGEYSPSFFIGLDLRLIHINEVDPIDERLIRTLLAFTLCSHTLLTLTSLQSIW